MKTLPDNPNLDHLRQQAKDLLAGLRDARPAATLAQAQALLAEQYGFRGWTDLKGEVDRRQGRADVADPALARELARRYDLGEVRGEMRSVARPDESGRRWTLETDRGRWAVRTMDTWWPIVDVETEVALQVAAHRHGVASPAAVRGRDGAVVESVDGHTWRVHEWRPAGPPMSAPAGSAVTRVVGGILATIHGLAMPVDRISPWHTRRFSSTAWPEVAATAAGKAAPWAPALAAAVPDLMAIEEVGAEESAAPPPVLSHNNLTPGNVRRDRDGALIVAGWEHVGGQPPAWELSEALTQWTVLPDGGINAAGARAMLAGYAAGAGAVPTVDMTTFRGAAVGLLNYVAGQIDEALTAADDETRRHADRSVSHLLAHRPTRATFERLVELASHC